jgi:hypothetical protein
MCFYVYVCVCMCVCMFMHACVRASAHACVCSCWCVGVGGSVVRLSCLDRISSSLYLILFTFRPNSSHPAPHTCLQFLSWSLVLRNRETLLTILILVAMFGVLFTLRHAAPMLRQWWVDVLSHHTDDPACCFMVVCTLCPGWLHPCTCR